MKFKLKPIEKKWILYDIGNSAFALLISTIIPIYFNYLAGDAGISEVNYLAYWGYATSAATVIVAMLGPLLGTVSDAAGRKKRDKLHDRTVSGGIGLCIFLDLCSPGFGFCVVCIVYYCQTMSGCYSINDLGCRSYESYCHYYRINRLLQVGKNRNG